MSRLISARLSRLEKAEGADGERFTVSAYPLAEGHADQESTACPVMTEAEWEKAYCGTPSDPER